VILKYEQLIETSRLHDEWENNVETKFAELKAQIARKQEKLKTLQKAMNATKAERKKQNAAEIHVVRNYERERNEMSKTLNESATHSLNSTAKAAGIKYVSRRLTSKLGTALGERLELQTGHLQRDGMRLDETSAEFVRKLKQGIRFVEDETKAVFHST
jgi:Fe2+ transport system protein B